MTEKQNLIRGYMLGYYSKYGEYPTTQEIADDFKMSRQAAGKFIRSLVKKNEIPGRVDDRGRTRFDYRNVPNLYASAVAQTQKPEQPQKKQRRSLDDLLS